MHGLRPSRGGRISIVQSCCVQIVREKGQQAAWCILNMAVEGISQALALPSLLKGNAATCRITTHLSYYLI